MKSKFRRRDDSNFILQSYCAFFFHFSADFSWLTQICIAIRILKLNYQNYPKKKKNHFMFWPGIHLLAEIVGFRQYGRYAASMTSIFSGTK